MYDNGDDRAAVTGTDRQAPLTLTYQLTLQDFTQALGARRKVSVAARRQLIYSLVCGAPVLAAGAVALANGQDVPMPLFLGSVFFTVVMIVSPRLQARQFHKVAARHGEYGATVGAAGVTIAHQHAATTLAWQAGHDPDLAGGHPVSGDRPPLRAVRP